MDISAIGGNYVNQAQTALNQEDKTTKSFESALKAAQLSGDETELYKACEEFESYFLQIMFKEMRNTIPKGEGLIAKSNAEDIFQDMLDEEYSKSATSGGGIGLAKFMYKQMSSQYNAATLNQIKTIKNEE